MPGVSELMQVTTVLLDLVLLTVPWVGPQGFESLEGRVMDPHGLWFGSILLGPGDLDGDGTPDVLVGDPGVGSKGESSTLWAVSGQFDRLLYALRPRPPAASLRAVVLAGDVDGDGVADILLRESLPGGAAKVLLYSGRAGKILLEIDAPRDSRGWGSVLARIGDVDGDARPDLAIGEQGQYVGRLGWNAEREGGRVHVHSGGHGRRLYTVPGPASDVNFGSAIGAGPDVDDDGVPDFAVGSCWPEGGRGPFDLGRSSAHIVSGRSGELIRRVDPVRTEDQPHGPPRRVGVRSEATTVAFLRDIDGGGEPELLVGAQTTAESDLYVVRGETGRALWDNAGRSTDWSLCPDLDDDGLGEIIIGEGATGWGGSVHVRSLSDWSVLRRVTGGLEHWHLGTQVAAIGDLDGDGIAEWAVADIAWGSRDRTGIVQIRSGEHGSRVLRELRVTDVEALPGMEAEPVPSGGKR